MKPGIPPASEILVRATGRGPVPTTKTPPMLSASALSVPGFVFERHNLSSGDLTPGKLVRPVVVFPLTSKQGVYTKQGHEYEHWEVRPGTFCVLPAGMWLEASWAGSLDMLLFSFDVSWCRRMSNISLLGEVNLRHTINAQNSQLFHLAMALKAEVATGCPTGQVYAESVALAMSLTLLRPDPTAIAPVTNAPGDALTMQTILAHIREHLADDLDADTLAHIARTTQDNFRRLFKRFTRVTPHKYVLQQRIKRAKHLLQDPALPLTDIAFRVGFSSHAHFATAFRKAEGVNPSDFRERIRLEFNSVHRAKN
jgi:AraC family transcriptional regulator